MLEAVAGTGEGAVGGRGGPPRGAGEEDGDAARSREALEGRGHIRGAGSEGGVLSGYGCQVGTGKAQLLGARYPGGKGWGSSGFPALTFQPAV